VRRLTKKTAESNYLKGLKSQAVMRINGFRNGPWIALAELSKIASETPLSKALKRGAVCAC
jgi:hypothetical protein